MPQRLGLYDNRKISYFIVGALTSLFLSAVSILVVHAQSTAVQSGQPARTEAEPFIVERRQIGDGPKAEPLLRFELRFGELREKCRTWHFETSGQADGHAVFDLKEPVDRSIILDSQSSPQYLELVLGDADCNYRIRIERNK